MTEARAKIPKIIKKSPPRILKRIKPSGTLDKDKIYIMSTIPMATKVSPPIMKIQCTSFLVIHCKRIISTTPKTTLNQSASQIES